MVHTRSAGKAAGNFHSKKSNHKWGEDFELGSGGMRFEGGGGGRTSKGKSNWVSGMGLPTTTSKKAAVRQVPGSKVKRG